MKKYFFILLFFLGCETFDVVADNPLDPSNPDYELPMVSITLLNYISLDKIEIVGFTYSGLLGSKGLSVATSNVSQPNKNRMIDKYFFIL